ncbi:uncharacterized protein LOC142220931 [Haematobia irritans]|uniref:uncharacterized protein LOC142220931 n=1 Tax=Haematobia irritans TaxID=7368 RepID=UPI003F508F98
MRLRPRLRYNYIKFVILIMVCGAGLYYYLSNAANTLDKQSQIAIMERSIRSVANQGECRMPDLPLDNPEIMKFYKKVNKVDCGKATDDWVMCEKSICFVKPEVLALHGDVSCFYTDIIRKTDSKSRYGKSLRTSEPYVLQESDFVKVFCTASDGSSWFGMAFGIRDGVEKSIKHKHPIPPPLDNANPINVLESANDLPSYFNVLMFGFDSLSRNAFIRKLPKTYEYLTDRLGAKVLTGYNIVGDGTPQALVPILTGYNELELPETRRRMSNAISVDQAYPLIWKDYEEHGYITSFNEDIPNAGTFTYRMKGFDHQPVHHYLRTYYVEVDNILTSSSPFCAGHTPGHMVMLDYTKNFMAKYSDTPRFVFSFHGELSHDSINMIEAADDDVVAWFEELQHKNLLDNTILIFMADHGNRFSDVRSTLQGKQEERLPFFSFTFPESFKKRFPREYENFVENIDRLTTPFDVHATLKHILDLQKPTSNDLSYDNEEIKSTPNQQHNVKVSDLAKNRAISLFDNIPKNRSCADAYIEPHWCACLNWQQLNVTNELAVGGPLLKAAGSIINTINTATEKFRTYCEPLQLKQINWAMRLMPHSALLAFKGNADVDGYMAEMGDKTHNSEVIYQLQIMVSPGDSLFEASVYHHIETQKMNTKLTEISRVNKYGSQANCIYERNPELRKYCYCKQ